MSRRACDISRRRVLSWGGLSLGLPVLDAFLPKRAFAQMPPAASRFVALVVNGNGVVQAGSDLKGGSDPEKFWPKQVGPLTVAGLAADKADRTLGDLADYAPRMLLVRGIS